MLGATPPPAALPKGCDIIHDYTLHTLVLRCVFTSLVGVDLRHFNLFGSDFDSVNLSGANLSHQDLAHVSGAANLPHVDLPAPTSTWPTSPCRPGRGARTSAAPT